MKLQKNQGSSKSYFLIIPSPIIRAKGWQKGDDIAVEITDGGDLLLKKEANI